MSEDTGSREVKEITIDVWSVLGVVGVIAAFVVGIGLGRVVIGNRSNQPESSGQSFAVDQNQVQQSSSVQGQQIEEGAAEPAQITPRAATSDDGVTVSVDSDAQLIKGEPPPGFTLTDIEGKDVALSDFKGQPVLLNFWATWCAPCRIEMPVIEDAYQKYKEPEGLVVLAVNMQETEPQVSSFFDSYRLSFPTVLDKSGEVSRAYSVRAIPTSVFVNRSGIVTDIHRGMLTESSLNDYLQDIFESKED